MVLVTLLALLMMCHEWLLFIFLKNKSENFKVVQAFAKKQTGKSIKVLRSDNGTEYVNNG